MRNRNMSKGLRPYFCHITLTYLCKIMLCNMLSEAAFFKKNGDIFLSFCPVGLSLLNQKTLKHGQTILASVS